MVMSISVNQSDVIYDVSIVKNLRDMLYLGYSGQLYPYQAVHV